MKFWNHVVNKTGEDLKDAEVQPLGIRELRIMELWNDVIIQS